jgi:hypothetical protein
MDAEVAQLLYDTVSTLERAVTTLTKAVSEFKEMSKSDTEHGASTEIVRALEALREELKAQRPPPVEPYDLLTESTYDKAGNVIKTITRRVPARRQQ